MAPNGSRVAIRENHSSVKSVIFNVTQCKSFLIFLKASFCLGASISVEMINMSTNVNLS